MILDASNTPTELADCLIAFGSNEGPEEAIFSEAVQRLRETDGIVDLVTSQPVRTAPIGGPDGQPEYLNAAIRFQTDLAPKKLHEQTIQIEKVLGRERRTRWGARKIDLDILLYGEICVDHQDLTVPHPRMSFRRFVLDPANAVAGDMLHPVCQQTIEQLVQHLNQKPNQIIWFSQNVGSARPICDQILQNESAQGWKIQVLDEENLFSSFQSDCKLLVYEREIESWRGPRLRVSGDASQAKIEIVAAIEAMSS